MSIDSRSKVVIRAGVLSVVAGVVILAVKIVAWWVTGSSALLADASESVVNVVAAVMATYSVFVAAQPADENHPYGHGKAEALSAAVEGLMIGAAAMLIVVESVRKIIDGPELERIGTGILIAGVAGAGNLLMGLYLVRVGRRENSEALQADGSHLLTDVVTTVGAIVALIAVQLTGFALLDPIAGLLVAANILVAAFRLARRALGGLLDAADFEMLARITHHLEANRHPEWIEVHQFRARRSGAHHLVDLHLTVPRYLDLERAHLSGDELEAELREFLGSEGGAVVHLDPCVPPQCPGCVIEGCPVREAPFRERLPFEVVGLTRLELPKW